MRFPRHALLFVVVNGLLHGVNAYTGAPWWAFWPLVAWGAILLAHYLVYRARRVDERWVKERTDDVRSKSYDRAHMDSIRARHSDTE
jgi:type VI protein secretion system component VasK